MLIEQFIDRLQQQGLLDNEIVEDLRRKVKRASGKKITAEAIAKYLVDKGHLTPFQATRLVNEVTSWSDTGLPPSITEKKEKGPKAAADELTLAPDEEEVFGLREPRSSRPPTPAPPEPTRSPAEELDNLLDIEERPTGGQPKAERVDTARLAPDDVSAAGKKQAEQRGEAKRVKEQKPAAGRGRATPATTPPSAPPAPPPTQPPPKSVTPPAETAVEDWAAMEASGSPLDPATGRKYSLAQRKLQKSSEWDSVLLLVGGASLGVLIIVGSFLYLSLTRGAAEELFAAAEAAYKDASYSLAIKGYNKYLQSYPRHERASLARVKREAAQLRQVYQDPERGLRVAQEELPKVENEEAFDEIRDELASMLPQIARGFVDEALGAQDPSMQESLLAKTAQAMELVNNPQYIPSRLRKSQQTAITSIEEDVARVQREIDRERSLVETINAIESTVATGETQLAYEARQELLDRYPGLDADPALQEAVLKVSEKERERVRQVDEPVRAVSEDTTTLASPRVLLAHVGGQAVAGVSDYVAYVLVGGNVFALDASTGDVLWRRFVGVETLTHPLPLSNQPGADALVVDRRGQALLRLAARTGKLIWRLNVGEPFADPLVLDNRLYVAARSGRLLVIDTDTGGGEQHVLFPQPLEVGPGATSELPCCYQLGDQDNLYVLSRDTLECREVFYLGHKRGTISVPPVMVLGHLFVVENAGPDFSFLHILACDAEGLNLRIAQPKIRLQGQVLVPPIVDRRRVLVVTDRRAVELFDVEPDSESGGPVISAGRQNATPEDPMISYALLTGGYMWIANTRLAKFQVQASTGKLPSEWVLDEQDVYVAPLQLIRDVVVHARRRRGAEGVTVAATRLNDKDPSWQTELAVPLSHVSVTDNTVAAITSRGRLFEIAAAAWEAGILTRAQASASRDERVALTLQETCPLGDDQWVLSPRSNYGQVVMYRARGENAGLRLLTLTVPMEDTNAAPTVFQGGLLTPLRDGRVTLLDPVTGAERVRPFHPEITAAKETRWFPPAVSEDGSELLIGNDQRRVYRVGINAQPQSHLERRGELTATQPICAPLAALGGMGFGVTRSSDSDTLFVFSVPELKVAQQRPLEGRVSWGPQRVGDMVLLATDTELFSMNAEGQERWRIAWAHGPLVGTPLLAQQRLYLVTARGSLWALDAVGGELIAAAEIGEPLSDGPFPFQDRLLVAGEAGVLFDVAPPTP